MDTIIPKKWQNQWISNEVIVLVLASLSIQIGLVFLAPLRKRIANVFLRLIIWLLYLTADYVATLALGNISKQPNPAESGDSGTKPGELTVLWAPFLLLHLGGPDSITSYSIEDNELWWRHLLGLVVQVLTTVYVFWQSPPNRLMWIPSIFVFIAGLIKFTERTHALRLGSKDNLKDKIISELIPVDTINVGIVPASIRNSTRENKWEIEDNHIDRSISEHYDIPANETKVKDLSEHGKREGKKEAEDYHKALSTSEQVAIPAIESKVELSEKESQEICEGYVWLHSFKRLLVDVTFSSNLLMQSQERFSDMSARKALNLVTIELSFLYDILHTKAVHMHSNLGRVLRCISLVSIIAALVVFRLLDKQNYASKDIIITYILLDAGIILDVIAVVLLVSSDWTVVSLRKKGWGKSIARAITKMVKQFTLMKGKSRWSKTIRQYNIVGLCLRDRYTPRTRIMKKLFKLKHVWDNMRESRFNPLPELLEDIMFTEAKRRAQNVHIYNVLVEARSYRGSKAMQHHGELENLKWSINREFDECIILWHLATDICYYNETSNQPKGNNDTERDVSWKTSNYMVYLLTQQQSMMQLGYGKTRFEAICAVIKKKFKGKGKLEDKNAREELIKNALVLEQNDAQVSADGHHPTNKMGKLVLKKIWAYLRSWGRRKGEDDKRKWEDEKGESVLKEGIRLAKQLQEIKPDIKRWQVISETWMEMLGYAAIHCDSYQHAKTLRRGGELLTHLWLLMAQLGVIEEHMMQQLQSGSV
ncbi:hypothetical protein FCM35_KLT17008 [Carex littledalei]|uniref:DUF4220 domain-containing protein n=1 Tax=Carex littledalei TaxID=544730 RepID=A0A833VGR8_9POAL|nr:hypothetical protein FCM35_KLT17008 [Carex littledalei]